MNLSKTVSIMALTSFSFASLASENYKCYFSAVKNANLPQNHTTETVLLYVPSTGERTTGKLHKVDKDVSVRIQRKYENYLHVSAFTAQLGEVAREMNHEMSLIGTFDKDQKDFTLQYSSRKENGFILNLNCSK